MRLDRLYERLLGGEFLAASHPAESREPADSEEPEEQTGSAGSRVRDGKPAPEAAWFRAWNWVLVEGNRRVVTGLLAVTVYAVLVALGSLWPFEIQTLLSEQVTVQRLFTTLLSGVILLVSIVVSINSLVVSQELAPIGSQHERVVASWEFRDRVADALGSDVTPANPDEFLETLVDSVQQELDALSSVIDDSAPDAHEDVREYLGDAADYLARTRAAVRKGGVGVVDVALFGPAYEPSGMLQQARRLRRHGSPDESVQSALGTVVEALQFFTTTREYFKTVYYKREFSRLSRDLLYTGLPAILLMSYVLLALDARSFPGSTLGLDHLFLFVSLAYVIALLPFLALTSYVLRAALIAEQTITAGAFVVE